MALAVLSRHAPPAGASRAPRASQEIPRLSLPLPGSDLAVTEVELAPGARAGYGQAERLEILYCLEGLGELTNGETGEHHAVVAGTIWIAPPGARAELMAFRGMRVMRVVAPAVR